MENGNITEICRECILFNKGCKIYKSMRNIAEVTNCYNNVIMHRIFYLCLRNEGGKMLQFKGISVIGNEVTICISPGITWGELTETGIKITATRAEAVNLYNMLKEKIESGDLNLNPDKIMASIKENMDKDDR